MKLNKKQQQFIRDSYESTDVCEGWKDKIKANFPKLFKETELELNKWYNVKGAGEKWLFFFKEIKYNIRTGYGLDLVLNLWADRINFDKSFDSGFDRKFVLATKEEVEKALIAEAKKRGYNEHTMCKCIVSGSYDICGSASIQYEYTESKSLYCGAQCIFKNGKWAEIIESISLEEAEKKLGKKIIV